MYALCSDAMLKAITRQARAVDEKVKAYNAARPSPISIAYFFDHLASEEDTAVMVMEEDFIEAHRELVPSVSADELKHYERVRHTFEGAGKKEDNTKAPQDGEARGSAWKGKGRAIAPPEDEESFVVHTENIDLNGGGSGSGSASGGSSSKGKGKAPAAGHVSRNSTDIAEGGFGDAAEGDEELYS